MPKLVKNGNLILDAWQVVDSEASLASINLSEGQWILPMESFLSLSEQKGIDFTRHTPWITSESDISRLKPHLANVPLIALNFPAFMDGRCFSHARALREQFEYKGELRAIGHFIQDQVFYLSRCGIDAFLLADDMDVASVQESLQDFSESYQAAIDEPQPLFRRRA